MARDEDNHSQQRCNHGCHTNAKPSDDRVCHQTGNRQEAHQCLSSGTGSSYAAEIMEAIPNLHIGVNAPNQGMSTGQAGSNKSKKPFTGPYCAYHIFYAHRTEDYHDIHVLAEQRTQKKDHPSFRRNRGRNNLLYWSNEQRHG
ncbi:hypothetical protein Fot_28752 [Forsythia ovata]|uniref:Uncharacterized protein n=1 Tax=Forsythia ovata TaxID=205694 RepID=A0ABD1TPX2_9LAMI